VSDNKHFDWEDDFPEFTDWEDDMREEEDEDRDDEEKEGVATKDKECEDRKKDEEKGTVFAGSIDEVEDVDMVGCGEGLCADDDDDDCADMKSRKCFSDGSDGDQACNELESDGNVEREDCSYREEYEILSSECDSDGGRPFNDDDDDDDDVFCEGLGGDLGDVKVAADGVVWAQIGLRSDVDADFAKPCIDLAGEILDDQCV
jgi:hypothetical protein